MSSWSVLAVIVNYEGFPFRYEVFDGNRADVTTLEVILRTVELNYRRGLKITGLSLRKIYSGLLRAVAHA